MTIHFLRKILKNFKKFPKFFKIFYLRSIMLNEYGSDRIFKEGK